MKKWMGKGLKTTLMAVAGLATFGLADNPISSYHYLADPSCTADDEYFYIVTDSDDPAGDKGYTIKQLYAFRSRDMKNWTDFGVVLEANREYESIADIWASGVAINPKDNRFYIVYPDGGGGGVGVVGADNINGPYTNPIPNDKKLVSNWKSALVNCDGIANCFDPAILYDDDGTGYFTFGGGTNNARPHGFNFDLYKFNSDMHGIDVSSKVQLEILRPNGQRIQNSFEASYLHKNNGVYYLSYSTDFSGTIDEYTGRLCKACIGYATSKKIEGPYTYQGVFLENPNINGVNINANNNNHHGVAKFKDHWYVVYHDRRLVQASEHPSSLGKANPEPAFHRSVSVDEITYNGEKINNTKLTNEGPSQLENFNPYETYPALTSSKQRNVRSRTDWNKSDWQKGIAAKHVLLPLTSKESWIRVSGVDFSKEGAKSFTVVAASTANDNSIEIRSGSVSGTLAGTCDIKKTSNKNDYVENECSVTGLTGIVNELFLVFKGKQDSTMGILEWSFTCNGNNCKASEPQKQTPYGGSAVELPGIIEAENFDVPGSGYSNKSYSDNDSENQGDADFRMDLGVDIVKGGTGMAIGYTNTDEWLEYTVNVKTAGKYKMTANAASSSKGAAIAFAIDGKDVGETVLVDSTGANWSVYQDFDVGEVELTAGTHVVRLTIAGSYTNVDWFKFETIDENGEVIEVVKNDSTGTDSTKKEGAKDGKNGEAPEALFGNHMSLNYATSASFDVFDLKGNRIATFSAKNMAEAVQLWKNGNVKGDVRATGINLIRNRANGMVTKVRVNH